MGSKSGEYKVATEVFEPEGAQGDPDDSVSAQIENAWHRATVRLAKRFTKPHEVHETTVSTVYIGQAAHIQVTVVGKAPPGS